MKPLQKILFPLFVLIWACNVMLRPERLQIRANRMWLWAVITQPAFSLAFRGHDPWYALNILFVFAGTTHLLAWHYRYRLGGMAGGVLLLALMAWPLSVASYGVPGLVLALSLAIFLHHNSFQYRLAAGAAASPAAGTEKRFMPASFFYLAYAGHLLIIGLVRLLGWV